MTQRIYAIRTFLDGQARYEAGQIYRVSDDRARHFILLGWATYAGKVPLWRRLLGGNCG